MPAIAMGVCAPGPRHSSECGLIGKECGLLATFDPTLKIQRSGWQGNLMRKKLLYALTLDGLLQSAVPLGSRVSLTYRLTAPVSKTTSKPAAYPELYHMFMRGGEPAAHGA